MEFQFYKSTIMTITRVKNGFLYKAVSILQKYDYDHANFTTRQIGYHVSILQKYDYDKPARKYYFETAKVSILQKYDYDKWRMLLK